MLHFVRSLLKEKKSLKIFSCVKSKNKLLKSIITIISIIGITPLILYYNSSTISAINKFEINIVIPTLSKEQIANNDILKEKMIKALLKKDKSKWAYVPMSSDIFYGDTVSVNCFYISTKEVTNKEYMVFLNDLVINNKIDDYLKALPDTTKWRIHGGNNFLEPMVNMYLWHPAFANYPVVNISREGAQMYCFWLTVEANKKNVAMYKARKNNNPHLPLPNGIYINDVRIPEETEWMMAARGGLLGAEYPWGTNEFQNSKGCFLCNFGVNGSILGIDTVTKCLFNKAQNTSQIPSYTILNDGYLITAPTNSYNKNYYGLYCMSGNVAEMVWKNKTRKPGTKGGSWQSDYLHTKISATDEYEGITEAWPYIGFRPVFTATKGI